jgi:hypothetical protein
LRDFINGLSNNSFERSANSTDSIRETRMLDAMNARTLNSGVMPLLKLRFVRGFGLASFFLASWGGR